MRRVAGFRRDIAVVAAAAAAYLAPMSPDAATAGRGRIAVPQPFHRRRSRRTG